MLTSRFWPLCAAIAISLISSAVLPGGSANARSYKDYLCMTDEGGGRMRPCSANFKAQNPNWRGGEQCYTDEGYGRYRPCSANYKAKHKAKGAK